MKILQILFLFLGLTIFTNAQTNDKSILSGTVYDATGAVIPMAKVIAVYESGEKFETETNNEGKYSLNLLYKVFDNKSSANFKIAKYEIIVDLENRGFENFVLKDFKFVPSYEGKMYLDIALDSRNPEPCGYAGADCLSAPIVETTKGKIQNKTLKRPLEKSPKEQNKSKRKNKNNK